VEIGVHCAESLVCIVSLQQTSGNLSVGCILESYVDLGAGFSLTSVFVRCQLRVVFIFR
jgi:hypothetical protein